MSLGTTDLLYFKRYSSNAREPFKATFGSAGFDLCSAEAVKIEPNQRKLINTDLELIFPSGTYGRICDRSGLALRHGISVLAGTIDPDYTGLVKILLVNNSQNDFEISVGDRIAQIIPTKISFPKLKEAFHEQRETSERQNKGFGSSGTK